MLRRCTPATPLSVPRWFNECSGGCWGVVGGVEWGGGDGEDVEGSGGDVVVVEEKRCRGCGWGGNKVEVVCKGESVLRRDLGRARERWSLLEGGGNKGS